MITEDYVSFEVAKLLEEKGFGGDCFSMYVTPKPHSGMVNPNEAKIVPYGRDSHYYEGYEYQCEAPTLQMAMKWLREIYNKSIEVRSQGLKATGLGWIVEIYNLVNQDEEFHHPYTFPTYEQACEAAIKYCLENLI